MDASVVRCPEGSREYEKTRIGIGKCYGKEARRTAEKSRKERSVLGRAGATAQRAGLARLACEPLQPTL